MERAVAESRKVPAQTWRALLDGMLATDANAQLEKIKAPTVIFWGDRETIFPLRAEQETLAKRISNAKLTVYEETGHALHWERPERFAIDLAAWLDEPGD